MGDLIRFASLPELVMMVLVPLAIAGVLIWAGLRTRRRAALINATPRSNIAMADDGYRQFEGTIGALGEKPVTSPLTKSPCVWYHAKVEESVPPKRVRTAGPIWKLVNETTSRAPFLVSDATGSCVVFPDGADVTPTDRSLWYGATIEPTDTNPLKAAPDESPSPDFQNLAGPDKKFRYSEERIYAGNPLFVLGKFTTGLVADETADADEDEDEDEREDRASRKAAGTKASIRRGTGDPPFILAAARRDAEVDMIARRGLAAFGIAMVPLAIAAVIVWMRFS